MSADLRAVPSLFQQMRDATPLPASVVTGVGSLPSRTVISQDIGITPNPQLVLAIEMMARVVDQWVGRPSTCRG